MAEQNALKDVPIFQGLTLPEMNKVVSLAAKQKYATGAALIQESDPGSKVYLIISGRVDVLVSMPGRSDKEAIARLNAGELVGELSLLGRSRRSANVVAIADVEALVWVKDDLINLFEKEHRVGFYVMRNIATQLADRLTSMNMVLRNALTVPQMVIL